MKSALFLMFFFLFTAGSAFAEFEIPGDWQDIGSVEQWKTTDPRLTGDGTWDPAEGNTREPMPDYFLNGRYLETDEGLWRQLPIPTVNIEGFGNPRERDHDRAEKPDEHVRSEVAEREDGEAQREDHRRPGERRADLLEYLKTLYHLN